MTQTQYLGKQFDQMNEEEKNTRLVSRKSEFQTSVETGFCLVALDQGKIVGSVVAYETLPFRGSVYVRYIAVRPNFQGKGIGSLLYKRLIPKSEGHGNQGDLDNDWP